MFTLLHILNLFLPKIYKIQVQILTLTFICSLCELLLLYLALLSELRVPGFKKAEQNSQLQGFSACLSVKYSVYSSCYKAIW